MENGAPQNEGRDPSGFLSQIIGNAVTVKLNSGVVYKGEWEWKPACSCPSDILVFGLIPVFIAAATIQSFAAPCDVCRC